MATAAAATTGTVATLCKCGTSGKQAETKHRSTERNY
jgi:hypothetical protein